MQAASWSVISEGLDPGADIHVGHSSLGSHIQALRWDPVWCYTSTASEFNPARLPPAQVKHLHRQVATLQLLSSSTAPGHIATTGEEEHQRLPNSTPQAWGSSKRVLGTAHPALQHWPSGQQEGCPGTPTLSTAVAALAKSSPLRALFCTQSSVLIHSFLTSVNNLITSTAGPFFQVSLSMLGCTNH